MSRVEHLRLVLSSESAKALASCSRDLRVMMHSLTQRIVLEDEKDIGQLVRSIWPQLAVITLRHTQAVDLKWPQTSTLERMASFGQTIGAERSTVFLVRSRQKTPSAYNPDQDLVTALSFMHKPQWQSLTQLTILSGRLNFEAATEVATIHWPNLTKLVVTVSSLDAAAMTRLIQGHWPSLHTLHLMLGNFDKDLVEALMQGHWPSLEVLGLTCSMCYGDCNIAFMPSQLSWPNLTTLSLQHLKLDVASFDRVTEVHHTSLQCLRLGAAGVTTACLEIFTQKQWLHLAVLHVANNDLGADEMLVLCQAELPNLLELGLNDNHIGATSLVLLAEGRWPKLTELDLYHNDICADGIKFLTKACWPDLCMIKVDRKVVCQKWSWTVDLAGNKTRKYCIGNVSVCGDLDLTSVPQPDSVYLKRVKQSTGPSACLAALHDVCKQLVFTTWCFIIWLQFRCVLLPVWLGFTFVFLPVWLGLVCVSLHVSAFACFCLVSELYLPAVGSKCFEYFRNRLARY